MKLKFDNSPTITSEDMVVSQMGLAEESTELFTYYLRSKIYENKVLAPIREYICNAIDEHLKYNISEPVKVDITKEGNQLVWSVRDYAKGLSDEDVRNIFGMYGRSTKRDSNTQVGMYGLGSKSAMAYTDTFYVSSYHEGLEIQYIFSLGAAKGGVPVGEIYEILRQPTTETGIKVSFDITKDFYDFQTTTKKFIEHFYSAAKIEFHDTDGVIITPKEPLKEIEVNGYGIKMYDDGYYNDTYVSIRMGGVVYDTTAFRCRGGNIGKFIVDVPIGKLSIPISRESLETTPSNTKVLDEIKQIINDLHQMDVEKMVPPKFSEVGLSHVTYPTFTGDFFKIEYNDAFPNIRKLKNMIEFANYGQTKGQNVVYVLPNIKSVSSWVKRLEFFVNSSFPNTEYYHVKNTEKFKALIEDTSQYDLSDTLFVDVKTLKLPKLPKKGGEVAYLVFKGYHKRTTNAEELEEYVSEAYYAGADAEEGWYEKADNWDLLNSRTIGYVKDWGSGKSFWTTNSKKMKEGLIELGWIDRESDEYTTAYERIRDIKKAQENMDNAGYHYSRVMFNISPSKYTTKVIGKNPANLDRIKKVKELILNEDSFRGRVLKSMGNQYALVCSRADIRKILKMK